MIWLAPNTTYCPDTPDNQARFEAIKAGIIRRNGYQASAGFENAYSPPEVVKKPKAAPVSSGPIIIYGYNTCKG